MSVADHSQSPAFRSVNRVLMSLAVLAAGWTFFGTSVNLSRFGGLQQAVGQRKVPLSGLMLAALDHPGAFGVILAMIAGTCIYVTIRQPERRSTVYFNLACIIVPLLWWILHTMLFYSTHSSILEMHILGY